MRTFFVSVAAGSLIALVQLGGCGGQFSSSSSDGGTTGDGSTGGDGGGLSDGGLVADCPTTIPGEGAACARNGLECEYGDDPNIYCNTRATCMQGRWTVNIPPPGCPTPPPDAGPGVCPASYSTVPKGQHCASLGAVCTYPEGRCACTDPPGPFPLDASASAQWFCEDPAPGCPRPRARVGSACSREGLQCDYGACYLPGGTALECKGGVWTEALVGCPASGGH